MRLPVVPWLRRDAGQALVELALSAPILIFGLIGGLDLMRVAAIQQAVQNAARAGAEVISLNNQIDQTTVLNVIRGELNGTPGLGNVSVSTCSVTIPPSPSPCTVLPARSGVVYQGTLTDGTACSSNAAGICYVRVRVIFRFTTIVQWPYVPNSITVDRGTSMPLLSG